MPRRYPRLLAKDRQGKVVSIPLSIAPLLPANEDFVSLPQRKVNEIAEANERVRTQEAGSEASELSGKGVVRDVYKRDEANLENVGSSITGTVSPEGSSSSASQEKNLVKKKRVRRLWTAQEDDIVLAAVLNKKSGRSLIGKLGSRSSSAVLKRFYVVKERVRRGEGKEGREDAVGKESGGVEERVEEESLDEYESYDEGVDEDADEDGYRPDEDMDVIAPL